MMDYPKVLTALQQRALSFHRALEEGELYSAKISEAEFLERVDDPLSRRAKNVVQGIEELPLTLLSLPVGLVYSLLDLLPAITWDYEFGYEDLLGELKTLFDKASQRFSWEYDLERSILDYALNNHSWSMTDLTLHDEVDPLNYLEIRDNLSRPLRMLGLTLYDATTGDQTGMLILMPVEAVGMLKDHLISIEDPRAEWFYTGVPETDK